MIWFRRGTASIYCREFQLKAFSFSFDEDSPNRNRAPENRLKVYVGGLLLRCSFFHLMSRLHVYLNKTSIYAAIDAS